MRLSKGVATILIWMSVFMWISCGQETYPQGKAIYTFYCQNCHMEDGIGLEGLIPTLAGNQDMYKNRDRLACIIRYGSRDTTWLEEEVYHTEMTGIPVLTETEIANVLNYIHNNWGNKAPFFSLPEVMEDLSKCEKQ